MTAFALPSALVFAARVVCSGLPLVMVCALCPGAARADDVLLLPHSGDEGLQGEREEAQAALSRALGAQGMRALPLAQVARHVDAVQADGCERVACAPGLLSVAKMKLAAATAVWRTEEGLSVAVTLVDAAGRYPAVAQLGDGAVAEAAEQALFEALGLYLLGPGPWIEVKAQPAGAKVFIDGDFAGTAPYRAALGSGDYDLEVRAAGYRSEQQTVQQPLDSAHITRVEVALEPGGAALDMRGELEPGIEDAAGERMRSEASMWNYLLGGALIATGLAVATIDPVRAAINDGDCVDASCSRVYSFGTDSVLKIAAGTAMVGAGVTLIVWSPFRVETRVAPGHAGLRVRGTF